MFIVKGAINNFCIFYCSSQRKLSVISDTIIFPYIGGHLVAPGKINSQRRGRQV